MYRIGLDINESSIKACQIESRMNENKLVDYFIIESESKLNFLSFNEDDIQKTTNLLRKKVVEKQLLGIPCNISITDKSVFIKVLEFPSMSDAELKKAIKLETENISPIPLSKASTSAKVIKSKDNSKVVKVLVVIAPKDLINNLLNIVKNAGLNVKSLEPSSFAMVRSAELQKTNTRNVMFVDIGFTQTSIIIYHDNLIRFTRVVEKGFNDIYQVLMQKYNIQSSEAISKAIDIGLIENANHNIKTIITPVYNFIFSEITRAILYYQSIHQDFNLEKIIFSGEGSIVPGLVTYAKHNIAVDAEILNPFETLVHSAKKERELEFKGPIFSVPVGLTLKEFI